MSKYKVVVIYTSTGIRVAARYCNKEEKFIELSWITDTGINYKIINQKTIKDGSGKEIKG